MANQAKKILVVEDNRLFQQMYFDKLVKEGFVVIQAFTGPQGVTMATNYKPDLIILDIMLPGGMNGFDILSQLRNNPSFKHTPIIMLTDLKNEEQTARQLGASDYLVKTPTITDQLMLKIKEHLKLDFVGSIKKILE